MSAERMTAAGIWTRIMHNAPREPIDAELTRLYSAAARLAEVERELALETDRRIFETSALECQRDDLRRRLEGAVEALTLVSSCTTPTGSSREQARHMRCIANRALRAISAATVGGERETPWTP